MRVLAVGDISSPYYYEHYKPGMLDNFDLILAAGDLRKSYLEFLATLARCPVVYVRGNHDDSYAKDPPEGCVCAEDKLVVYQGLRILGLGGSYRYRRGENMYTEGQMRRRIWKLTPQIWLHHGFDILLTHAPARHLNDLDNLTHQGFQVFGELMDRYRPSYFVHAHIHPSYGPHVPQKCQHGDTTVINAFDHCEFEL